MEATKKRETCEERIQSELDDRLTDIKALFGEIEAEDVVFDEKRGEGKGEATCGPLEASYSPADYDDEEERGEAVIEMLQDAANEQRYEYGLCADYVSAGTFDDDGPGYFRYQLSWGGPSDEFRFFLDADQTCYKVTYCFQDWFDGAERVLYGTDKDLLLSVFADFAEMGVVEAEIEKARDDS